MDKITNRHLAAKLSRQLFTNKIAFNQFVDDFPDDTNDADIDKLFDLIEHQPKLGGLFGVNQTHYDNYYADILKLIEKLEK